SDCCVRSRRVQCFPTSRAGAGPAMTSSAWQINDPKNTKKNTMKNTIRIPGLRLVALLFAATSLASLAAPPHTGIQGHAALYISYGTPVEVEPGVWVGIGDVMMPVTTSFGVLSAQSGHEVGRFSTDATGAITVS